MNFPKTLTNGDKVAIVATARKISFSEINSAIILLENWGLEVRVGRSIGLQADQFAGSDQERAQDLQNQIDDREIKAIWCARGGYGTVRLIDALDFNIFRKHPKWIMGYSDITVLHSHVHRFQIATIHAPMPVDIMNATNDSVVSLQDALFGKALNYKVKPKKKNRIGSGKGVLVGGNLSILYSLCGSPSALETTDKILFIEDLDEYLYHIDRMLQNLKRNGMLKNLKGLIVGSMTIMHDNTIPFGKTVKELILDTVQAYDYPVIFDFPAGHQKDNRALVFGQEVQMTVTTEKVSLAFL